MPKRKKRKQREIDTELGLAFVSIVPASRAFKTYECPLCGEDIPMATEHSFVEPEQTYALRRHIHSDCLEYYIENKLMIRLHPNDPKIALNYYKDG